MQTWAIKINPHGWYEVIRTDHYENTQPYSTFVASAQTFEECIRLAAQNAGRTLTIQLGALA